MCNTPLFYATAPQNDSHTLGKHSRAAVVSQICALKRPPQRTYLRCLPRPLSPPCVKAPHRQQISTSETVFHESRRFRCVDASWLRYTTRSPDPLQVLGAVFAALQWSCERSRRRPNSMITIDHNQKTCKRFETRGSGIYELNGSG